MSTKEQVMNAVEALPENASFEDIVYAIEIVKGFTEGKEDIAEGRVHSHAEIRREFGLDR